MGNATTTNASTSAWRASSGWLRTLAFRGRTGRLAVVTVVMSTASMLSLAVAYGVVELIGQLTQTPPHLATQTLAWIAGAVIAQAVLNIVQQRAGATLHAEVLFDLRGEVYDALLREDLLRDARAHGDALTLLDRDTEHLADALVDGVTSVVPAGLVLLGASVALCSIHLGYGGLIVALIVLYSAIARLAARRFSHLSVAKADAKADANALANELLQMRTLIAALGVADTVKPRFEEREQRAREATVALHHSVATLAPASRGFGTLLLLGVAFLLGESAASGTLSATDLGGFVAYGYVLLGPLSTLADVRSQTFRAAGSVARLHAVLQTAQTAPPGGKERSKLSEGIQLEGVDVAYPGRPPVLRDLSLRLGCGETVVLAGENGSGKSTLVRVLIGLLPAERGSVRFDGVDASELSMASRRRLIAIVPQETWLLSFSVYDNIALGSPTASRDDVLAAGQRAGVDEFAEQLPQGYDTPIGELGQRLSGGQRQRIAIARALVRDPAVLVLDEATTHLDRAAEERLLEALETGGRERIVLFVSHRAPRFRRAYRTVRLVGGRAVEDGGERGGEGERGREGEGARERGREGERGGGGERGGERGREGERGGV